MARQTEALVRAVVARLARLLLTEELDGETYPARCGVDAGRIHIGSIVSRVADDTDVAVAVSVAEQPRPDRGIRRWQVDVIVVVRATLAQAFVAVTAADDHLASLDYSSGALGGPEDPEDPASVGRELEILELLDLGSPGQTGDEGDDYTTGRTYQITTSD